MSLALDPSGAAHSAPPPLDFDLWPSPARLLWHELTAQPTWRTHGFAHVSRRELAALLGRANARPGVTLPTVSRWLAWLEEHEELQRVLVRRGDALPNGGRVWCDHWIVQPGRAMAARGARALPVITPSPSNDQGVITERSGALHPEPLPSPREIPDETRRSRGKSRRGRPGAAPFKDSCLDLEGSRSLKPSSKLDERTKARSPEPTPTGTPSPVDPLSPEEQGAALRLLRHYAERTGNPTRFFAAPSIALVGACLRDMDGTLDAREARLRAVVDDALDDSQRHGYARPTLAFVFALRHVRRRLNRLAELAAQTDAPDADPFEEGFARLLASVDAALAEGRNAGEALDALAQFAASGRGIPAALLARHRELVARATAPVEPPARPVSYETEPSRNEPPPTASPMPPRRARPTSRRREDESLRDGPPRGAPSSLASPRAAQAESEPPSWEAIEEAAFGERVRMAWCLAQTFGKDDDVPLAAARPEPVTLTDEERALLAEAEAAARERARRCA